jgi:hypothetical protein
LTHAAATIVPIGDGGWTTTPDHVGIETGEGGGTSAPACTACGLPVLRGEQLLTDDTITTDGT